MDILHIDILDKVCRNWDFKCETWAEMGECDKDPENMHKVCAKACGVCSGDDDIPSKFRENVIILMKGYQYAICIILHWQNKISNNYNFMEQDIIEQYRNRFFKTLNCERKDYLGLIIEYHFTMSNIFY